jgi:serine/threonine protein kinase
LGPEERLIGTAVDGRYTLKKLLGRGGFGAVFEADDRYGPPCALKLIHCERLADRGDALREAALMEQHAHPGVVAFQESGRLGAGAGGHVYIAMELGEGSLHDRLYRRGPLPPDELRALLVDLLEALSHLHRRGVVHLDVKPGNLVRVGGRYKLCDFGAARTLGGRAARSARRSGTPEYMAPEVFELVEEPPADLWAVGMLVHECATGKLPFPVKDQEPEEIAHLVRETAPRIDPSLPAPFDAIVRGCLARDPARRWTVADVREALDRAPLAAPAPRRARRDTLQLAAVALVVVALALLGLACGEIARRPAEGGYFLPASGAPPSAAAASRLSEPP